MFRKTASFAIAGLTVFGTISETAAGGRAIECYEPVNRPAIYDTVYENVLVSPTGQLVDYDPPIYGTRERVVQTVPAQARYEIVPAITQTVYHTVKVDNGGYAWEWRVIHGRKVLCKVWRKARYQRVAETVVIEPERARRVVIPAEYDSIAEEVLVRPEQRRIVNIPPSYQTVARRVVVREGSTSWRRVHIPRHCNG
ncbi:hypothetical protein LGH82_07745 [Mesorhizobium sp. PAMC28654]|uniref:hypothetical protein n=1 Tax=Mesorhizobium sp. PAMC28654 TaxID=2880934 RepID=UPI001D09BCB9|nr:hypothetical protein [Mesorhizobium sp. PAMC28654]UDL91151.1 hypothetical protein LGH82_07745 [Mesorhizobium sp. PAMC28654]